MDYWLIGVVLVSMVVGMLFLFFVVNLWRFLAFRKMANSSDGMVLVSLENVRNSLYQLHSVSMMEGDAAGVVMVSKMLGMVSGMEEGYRVKNKLVENERE